MNRLSTQNPEIRHRYDFMMESTRALGELAWQMIDERNVVKRKKQDGTWVTNVDETLNDRFIEWVEQEFPGDLVWGEERSNAVKNDIAMANKHPLWLIDPIDGTKGFIRSYEQNRFTENTSSIMVTHFMPGETVPTMSNIYNPFQDQKLMISAHSNKTFFETDAAPDPEVLFVDRDEAPQELTDVRRFEQTHWRIATPDLDNFQKLIPRARIMSHQLFMGSIALGDVDVSVFPGPSNPHDVAPGALILHNAGGDVRTFANESFEQVDWRRFPIEGTVGTVHPRLGRKVVEQVMRQHQARMTQSGVPA